ncbi:MAG: DnaJ domain-containing protein [Desulfobacterales bacterium]|nr:MAG: DnaJ domain-containing protein [Desulfobacterales bacterium]
MTDKDYYNILGIDKNASAKQIKEAYRKLAFKYHPDRNKGNLEAAEKMKSLNEAYAVLCDSSKRREYDMLRQQFGSSAYGQFRQTYSDQDIFSGSDINHIFEQMARAFGFRGFDEIFKEFYGQGYRNFEFRKPGYFARGWVFTGPSGKRATQRPQFRIQGNLGIGKIYKYLFKKLSGFELPENGADINAVIYLSPQHAQEGGPYAYYLKKKAKKLVVKIPPGVKDGQKIRLAGMGEDGKGGGAPGDLFLKVHITKPLFQSVKDLISSLRNKKNYQ